MTAPILPPPDEAARLAIRPGSVTWEYAGDARAMLGAGVALLLQVAHPTVGAGVAEHSDFRRDPWGRLWRTLDFVNLLVYGGPEAAAETARRTREMHKAIKGTRPDGTRYHALEPEAYAWVHATLAEAIVATHERFGRPMGPAEKATFWQEWRGLGRLLGVRDRDLPEDWPGFRAYVDEMVETRLEDNETVRDVLATMQAPEVPPWGNRAPVAWRVARFPAARALELATIGLLHPVLRSRLGLRLTPAQEAELRFLGRASRATTPVLPRPLRTFGPTYLRWRRRAIRDGRFGRAGGEAPPVRVAA